MILPYRAVGALVLVLAACSNGARPPQPPSRSEVPSPSAPAPVAEPARLDLAKAPTATVMFAHHEAGASSRPGALPVAPPPPSVVFELEPFYRVGDARTIEEKHYGEWNRGGRGGAPPPDSTYHPLPRIKVDILRAKGPRKVRDIERIARRDLWSPILECYRASAYKNPELRGDVSFSFQITKGGKVTRAGLGKRSLKDDAVTKCLVKRLSGLAFKKARAASSVAGVIFIGPGDEPLAPPSGLVTRGDGDIDLGKARATLQEQRAGLEACYRSALDGAPGLWGRLAVRVHVLPDGAVDEAFEVETAFPDNLVHRCVLDQIRKARFEVRAGDARFIIPMRFGTFRSDPPAAETSGDD